MENQDNRHISNAQIQLIAERLLLHLNKQRLKRENQIPKIQLSLEHMENCELLLNREHLLERMKKNGIIAEIGVDEGKFSKLIFEKTKPSKLHLIDIWGSERFHDGKYQAVQSYFSHDISGKKVVIHKQISTEAVSEFEDEYFDWIYIDTDHSYETTRDELLLYASKMKSDGVIAGHDYKMGNWISGYRYGVVEAVHEFCVNYNWELIYLTVEPTESQSFAIRRKLPNNS